MKWHHILVVQEAGQTKHPQCNRNTIWTYLAFDNWSMLIDLGRVNKCEFSNHIGELYIFFLWQCNTFQMKTKMVYFTMQKLNCSAASTALYKTLLQHQRSKSSFLPTLSQRRVTQTQFWDPPPLGAPCSFLPWHYSWFKSQLHYEMVIPVSCVALGQKPKHEPRGNPRTVREPDLMKQAIVTSPSAEVKWRVCMESTTWCIS